jgi:tetratricopeptide (TPR) repeat protein
MAFLLDTLAKRIVRVALLLALVSASVLAQDPRYIEGQVRMPNGGSLPPDVTARLEAAERVVVAQTFVGQDGKFQFSNLRENLYRVVVTAKGFQTVTHDVDMNYLASRFVSVYLVPESKGKSPQSPESSPTPTDLAAPKKARKEYEKGEAALHDDKLDQARAHFELAIDEDPCYARAQTALGVTLTMMHNAPSAEQAFRTAIKCDGQFLEAYLQLSVLLNAQHKYKECEAMLQQGLRIFPSDWRLHYQLGIAQDGAEEYEPAEQSYLKAQTLHPDVPPEFHLKLADVYINRKEYDKAYAELQAYLALEPDSKVAEQTRKIMHQMENSGVLSNHPSAPH